jgi:phosphomannomutase
VISEEYTLPLSVYSVLDSKLKNVVVNLSTSFITKEIIEPYGKKLLLAKVGEANVVKEMIQSKAFFGGEGNGGVIDPKISSFGRDSLAGIGHILNFLSLNKTTVESN